MVSDYYHLYQNLPRSSVSLNPCCNGIWSQTFLELDIQTLLQCLNPCCNGIWSQTLSTRQGTRSICLNPCCNGIWSQTLSNISLNGIGVLILVVMEYGLRHAKKKNYHKSCLNPCCNGIWSQTFL